jgi:hypothetical protein
MPPKYNGPTASGDLKINKVLTGKLDHASISVEMGIKVGHKLTAMAKTNPRGAAQLLARLAELANQGHLKFLGKSEHGFPVPSRGHMFNGALVELYTHHKALAREFNLPPDPRKIMY